MKRDMELVRNILLFLEDEEREYYDGNDGTYMLINVEGYTKKEIDYHLITMEDGGIIKGDLPFSEGELITHSGADLNWKGHDFIETFSDDSYWNGTKKYIKDKGLEIANVPFDILLEIGKSYIKSLF